MDTCVAPCRHQHRAGDFDFVSHVAWSRNTSGPSFLRLSRAISLRRRRLPGLHRRTASYLRARVVTALRRLTCSGRTTGSRRGRNKRPRTHCNDGPGLPHYRRCWTVSLSFSAFTVLTVWNKTTVEVFSMLWSKVLFVPVTLAAVLLLVSAWTAALCREPLPRRSRS